VTFTSQLGTFDVSRLTELGARRGAEAPDAAPGCPAQPVAPPAAPPVAPPVAPNRTAAPPPVAPQAQVPAGNSADIIAAIESLAGLHERGILSDEEFAAKKTELLGRL
jgi:hypothetical protein